MASKRDRAEREKRLRGIVLSAQRDAALRVKGLFKKPDEAGYNPDADKTWKEATVATRAAIELTKGTMAAERARANAGNEGPKVFAPIFMVPQLQDAGRWEQMARAVDRGETIEVSALPAKDPEGQD